MLVASNLVGSVPGWLTVLGVAAVGWTYIRGGSGQAVHGLQDTNSELNRQIKERDGKISTLERINAELRAQKDVATAIEPVLLAMRAHEDRAQSRSDSTLKVLALIADRLGPDPNGNGGH